MFTIPKLLSSFYSLFSHFRIDSGESAADILFHVIMYTQQHLFLQTISIYFSRFNHDIYYSLIISNLFHFSWLAQLSLITSGSICPQVSVFLGYLLGKCNDKSKYCLLFHLSFSGSFIWLKQKLGCQTKLKITTILHSKKKVLQSTLFGASGCHK